jgi:hypothetical protein
MFFKYKGYTGSPILSDYEGDDLPKELPNVVKNAF